MEKIDMSLDDIIKLNRKEKKLERKKQQQTKASGQRKVGKYGGTRNNPVNKNHLRKQSNKALTKAKKLLHQKKVQGPNRKQNTFMNKRGLQGKLNRSNNLQLSQYQPQRVQTNYQRHVGGRKLNRQQYNQPLSQLQKKQLLNQRRNRQQQRQNGNSGGNSNRILTVSVPNHGRSQQQEQTISRANYKQPRQQVNHFRGQKRQRNQQRNYQRYPQQQQQHSYVPRYQQQRLNQPRGKNQQYGGNRKYRGQNNQYRRNQQRQVFF